MPFENDGTEAEDNDGQIDHGTELVLVETDDGKDAQFYINDAERPCFFLVSPVLTIRH